MSDAKVKFNPDSILDKAKKLRPAGSVKEWIEKANELLREQGQAGSFYYDDVAGKILFKKV